MRWLSRGRGAGILAGALLSLFLAPNADAHLVTTGLGPVYDGIGHFFLSPEDGIAVLVLALLAGERGSAGGRLAMWVVPVAWFGFGLAGLLTSMSSPLPETGLTAAVALTLLIPGLLVAADLRLPPWLLAIVLIASTGLHGFFNGIAQRPAGNGAGTLAMLGIALSCGVIATLVSALVVSLRIPWTRIVVRVAGSWIAAMGLLLLGWAFRMAR